MSEHQHSASSGSARERELEIEVARLQAELDTLRGEDPTASASRFLAMAAATVDKAVEDARREADEIVEEVSAQAEARRDEATRVAAEAEAMAEQLLADADRAQERIDAANEEADAIKLAAEDEADQLVQAERDKVAGEIEALAEVRSALEDERGALESYHEALRAKVQELAESMVSFMTTELPAGSASAIENLVVPELDAVFSQSPSLDAGEATADPADEIIDQDEILDEDAADEDLAADADQAADAEDGDVDTSSGDTAPSFVDEIVAEESDAEVVAEGDVFDEVPPVAAVADDPWGDLLESAIPEDEAYPDAVDMPADAIDEIPDGPPAQFAEHDIVEPTVPAAEAPSSSAGLFSRATPTETGFDDLTADVPGEADSPGLFGMLGSRLVEQTPPEALADALDSADSEDEAFHEFLAGDDEPDPSRDWLLRPEQG